MTLQRLFLCMMSFLLLSAGSQNLEVRWDLSSLDPSDPSRYFELAEEVGDAAESELERRLAIRLYAIAVTLDSAQWGRSGLLGIISLIDDESTIRSLRAMIELNEQQHAGLLPSSRVVLGESDRATLAAFDVLSFYRTGMLMSARRRLLNIPGVEERLLVYQDEIPGGMQRLLEAILAATESVERRRLKESDIVAQLQVQLRLLGGQEETWSTTLIAWNGRPMQSLESHDLGSLLNLDLSRQIWSNDRWIPIESSPASGDQ